MDVDGDKDVDKDVDKGTDVDKGVDKNKNVDPRPLRARRVRVHLRPEQDAVVKQWLGAVRFLYNRAVELSLNNANLPWKEVNAMLTLKALRARFVNADAPFMQDPRHAWLKDVPYEVRDNALRDFDKARKVFFAKRAKARAVNPTADVRASFKFRSRRDRQQTLTVRHRDWGRIRGDYSGIFRADQLKRAPGEAFPLPQKMEADFRLLRTRLGHTYIVVPIRAPPASESQAPPADAHGVVALDPGVRTFQTCYDADGQVTEWGVDDMQRIFVLCRVADRLQGRIAKGRTRQARRRRRDAWLRLLQRIRDHIDEVHKKMAAWLCQTYRVVLIPKFETQRMAARRSPSGRLRRLNGKTARAMCTWAHYRFRQRLLHRAELSPWCRVIECDEAYTSKTCGACGIVHHKLGGNKTFRCPQQACGYVADRDASAARNILIRFLTRKRVGVPPGTPNATWSR